MSDIQYFEALTTNAADWANYFSTVAVEYDSTDIDAVALSECIYTIMDILMEELEDAINRAGTEDGEFKRPLLKDHLMQVFHNYDIIQIAGGTVHINAETVAGDINDFWDGIEAARANLPGEGTMSAVQKANFWRHSVYPSYSSSSGITAQTMGDYEEEDEDLWSQTIAMRLQAWGDKAPYWLILEFGNAENELAYPHNEPTRFRYKAERRAQAVFDSAAERVEVQATNLVEDAAERFVNNPDAYQQYDVLEQFFSKGNLYYVYITSTRRVGVALEATYENLRSTYG